MVSTVWLVKYIEIGNGNLVDKLKKIGAIREPSFSNIKAVDLDTVKNYATKDEELKKFLEKIKREFGSLDFTTVHIDYI